MLRSRLPGNRVIPDPVERRRLLKLGAEMNHAVEHNLEIVSIKTYCRWVREEHDGREPVAVARPQPLHLRHAFWETWRRGSWASENAHEEARTAPRPDRRAVVPVGLANAQSGQVRLGWSGWSHVSRPSGGAAVVPPPPLRSRRSPACPRC